MTVYPISRSRHKTRAMVRALRKAGVVVSWDRTKGTKRTYTDDDSEIAFRDFKAAATSDAVLMAWCPGMKDAYTEMGIALASRVRVVVYGCPDKGVGYDNPRNDNIFLRLWNVIHFDTLGMAILYLETQKGYHR